MSKTTTHKPDDTEEILEEKLPDVEIISPIVIESYSFGMPPSYEPVAIAGRVQVRTEDVASETHTYETIRASLTKILIKQGNVLLKTDDLPIEHPGEGVVGALVDVAIMLDESYKDGVNRIAGEATGVVALVVKIDDAREITIPLQAAMGMASPANANVMSGMMPQGKMAGSGMTTRGNDGEGTGQYL